MTAIYVKNRLPSPKVVHKTPFEIVYNLKPSVKHMRVFGCQTYILMPKENRLKWDPKARAGIFLGYEEVSKAYRVYDIEAGQVVVSRDVNFDESTFGLPSPITNEDCYKVRAKRSEGSGETERGDEETGGSRAEDTCPQVGRFESD